MEEEAVRFWVAELAEALDYLRKRRIAHRDLKPANVLLTCHEPPIVKVADFGLAKLVKSGTMLRTACGTPMYAAPEVRNSSSGYDHAVDSWSLGMTLGELYVSSLH